jgi:hypothetical protein
MRKRASGVAVAVPAQVYFINQGTPHGFTNATQLTAAAVEVFVK